MEEYTFRKLNLFRIQTRLGKYQVGTINLKKYTYIYYIQLDNTDG